MYICFDLDDTLLNKKKEITLFTKQVLKLLQEKGHKLIINTARGYPATLDVINEIKPDYSVVNAGALVLDKDLNAIHEDPIDVDTTNEIIELLKGKASIISVQARETLYTNNQKTLNEKAVLTDYNERFNEKAYKIIPRDLDYDYAIKIKEKYDLDYCVYFNSVWSRFCTKNSTKINGLKKVIEYENGNMKDTISFGDDTGDLEMLLGSGIGVAMENSVKNVLEKVKIKTVSCDEDGVAVYLNKYFNLGLQREASND